MKFRDHVVKSCGKETNEPRANCISGPCNRNRCANNHLDCPTAAATKQPADISRCSEFGAISATRPRRIAGSRTHHQIRRLNQQIQCTARHSAGRQLHRSAYLRSSDNRRRHLFCPVSLGLNQSVEFACLDGPRIADPAVAARKMHGDRPVRHYATMRSYRATGGRSSMWSGSTSLRKVSRTRPTLGIYCSPHERCDLGCSRAVRMRHCGVWSPNRVLQHQEESYGLS